MAYTLLAEQHDWVDRLAAATGLSEPPHARERLDEQLADDVEVNEEASTNVVELAAWVEQVNRGMR